MEGGMAGVNVFSLRFRGANVSKDHTNLKAAKIRSLVDGAELPLDVAAKALVPAGFRREQHDAVFFKGK
jgi:hypothetical protein